MKKKENKRELRINEDIRSREVRLVNGSKVSVVCIDVALRRAREVGLDLVEVSSNQEPPVCKIMDYGKYKFEKAKKEKEAKKKQKVIQVKEIKLRPKIGDHDFEVKLKRIKEFLEDGNRVKVTVMFRGREITHPELGELLIKKIISSIDKLGIVDKPPKFEGKNLVVVLQSNKKEDSNAKNKNKK